MSIAAQKSEEEEKICKYVDYKGILENNQNLSMCVKLLFMPQVEYDPGLCYCFYVMDVALSTFAINHHFHLSLNTTLKWEKLIYFGEKIYNLICFVGIQK